MRGSINTAPSGTTRVDPEAKICYQEPQGQSTGNSLLCAGQMSFKSRQSVLIYFLCINLLWHGSWSWSSCQGYVPHWCRSHSGLVFMKSTTRMAPMRPPWTLVSLASLFHLTTWISSRYEVIIEMSSNQTSQCLTLVMQEWIWGRFFLLYPIPGSYSKSNSSACGGGGGSSNLCQYMKFINAFQHHRTHWKKNKDSYFFL